MPLVQGKHYPYTPAGLAAAKRAASRLGVPMRRARAAVLRGRAVRLTPEQRAAMARDSDGRSTKF